MSLSLSRREVILTQLCILPHAETDLLSQALRQIPRILEVLNLEMATPDEIYDIIKELQICRTEIALKTYIIYLSERDKSFRFFPTRAFWTQKINRDIHLILHLRGDFSENDKIKFFNTPEISHLIQGPYTYLLTPERVTESYMQESGTIKYIQGIFPFEERGEIFKFLLEGPV